MKTECNADLFSCAPVAGRAVVAGFDGGKMTSDAGALLLGAIGMGSGTTEQDIAVQRRGDTVLAARAAA